MQAIDGDRAAANGTSGQSTRPRAWRARLRDGIPLVSSLALHVAVIAIGLLTARAIQVAKAPAAAVEFQSAAVVTDFDESSLRGAVDPMKLAGQDDPSRMPAQDQFTDVSTTGWAKSPGPNRLPTLQEPGDPASADVMIGVGATDSIRSRRAGPAGTGDGGGGGGPLMPFGAPDGGGGGGGSALFPAPRNVRTVAYVCDASGSMIQTFGSLKGELTKAVTALKAVQGFNIVFFQDEKYRSLASEGLVLATPENKRNAFTFLDDTSPSGTTNPLPAIEAAFKSKAQVIFLLTDADFPDNAAVLSVIRRLNASKQTKVNTIAFTSGDDADPLSQGFIDLMKTIARENGGTFKVVKENEL